MSELNLKKRKKTLVSVELDDELLKKIKAICKRNKQSMRYIVELGLQLVVDHSETVQENKK